MEITFYLILSNLTNLLKLTFFIMEMIDYFTWGTFKILFSESVSQSRKFPYKCNLVLYFVKSITNYIFQWRSISINTLSLSQIMSNTSLINPDKDQIFFGRLLPELSLLKLMKYLRLICFTPLHCHQPIHNLYSAIFVHVCLPGKCCIHKCFQSTSSLVVKG